MGNNPIVELLDTKFGAHTIGVRYEGNTILVRCDSHNDIVLLETTLGALPGIKLSVATKTQVRNAKIQVRNAKKYEAGDNSLPVPPPSIFGISKAGEVLTLRASVRDIPLDTIPSINQVIHELPHCSLLPEQCTYTVTGDTKESTEDKAYD